jgi:hypothetical protein
MGGREDQPYCEDTSSDAFLRPSQIYRVLSRLPNEALALVLAKGLVSSKAVGIARLKRRLTRFLERDRHTTTTINGDTLKDFGLRPGPHFKKILTGCWTSGWMAGLWLPPRNETVLAPW